MRTEFTHATGLIPVFTELICIHANRIVNYVQSNIKARVCGQQLAGTAGSNPAGALMSVSCECCLL